MVSSKITPRICLIFYRKVRQIWGVIGVYIDYNMGSIYSTNKVKNINFTCNSCNSCWNRFTCTHGCVYEDIVQRNRGVMIEPAFCAYSKKMTELAIEICMKLPQQKLIKILGIDNQ